MTNLVGCTVVTRNTTTLKSTSGVQKRKLARATSGFMWNAWASLTLKSYVWETGSVTLARKRTLRRWKKPPRNPRLAAMRSKKTRAEKMKSIKTMMSMPGRVSSRTTWVRDLCFEEWIIYLLTIVT